MDKRTGSNEHNLHKGVLHNFRIRLLVISDKIKECNTTVTLGRTMLSFEKNIKTDLKETIT
jgi:hypothetical protein